MARDYRRRSRKKSGSGISKWVWIITFLLVASLVGFLLHITRAPETVKKPSYPVNSTPQPGTVKPKPKFDFYEKLPNKQINTPIEEMQMPPEEPSPDLPEEELPIIKPQPAEKPAPTSTDYYVQVGAFSKFDDADQLKAELTLMGFPMVIQSVNNNGDLQFRVRSGPFDTKAEAQTTQKELKESGYTSNVVQ